MKRDKRYLKDIYDVILDIETFINGVSEEEFYLDKEKQYAVRSALEIIGEATKNLSTDLKKNFPDIPWRQIAAMRNMMIHEYFRIKIELMWETAIRDIPELKKNIKAIIDNIAIQNEPDKNKKL